jgi:hypothetical protein
MVPAPDGMAAFFGALGWSTPAERYLGVPFADRGLEHIPVLEHLQPWREALMTTAA